MKELKVYAILKEVKDDLSMPIWWKVGDRFLVEDIVMGQSSTVILLEECQEQYFNSTLFDFEELVYTPLNIYADARFNPYLNMKWV